MVHDEEAEVSIRLATLIANSQRNRLAIAQVTTDNPEPSLSDEGQPQTHVASQGMNTATVLFHAQVCIRTVHA